ncbi:MAG TPA: hypothetical protein VHM16_02000 [Rubrobacteraceae bacterium]|nr:hypothetical protein [Rubrobacteraceae bacterium]
MRRRTVLLLAAMLVALAVAGGVALAATIDGTARDDSIRGTRGPDTIDGRGGDDVIRGLRGADTLAGSSGDDTINAGPRDETAMDSVSGGSGDDVILARNVPAARDVIDCGRGFDRAVVDSKDLVTGCNRVFR